MNYYRLIICLRLTHPAPKLPSYLSLVWTNLRVLLFINAFTYKLLNMIAIESPFVKDFRDFSETLKELHQTETFHDEKPSR